MSSIPVTPVPARRDPNAHATEFTPGWVTTQEQWREVLLDVAGMYEDIGLDRPEQPMVEFKPADE